MSIHSSETELTLTSEILSRDSPLERLFVKQHLSEVRERVDVRYLKGSLDTERSPNIAHDIDIIHMYGPENLAIPRNSQTIAKGDSGID